MNVNGESVKFRFKFTFDEAAEYLRISKDMMMKMVKDGDVRYQKIKGEFYILGGELDCVKSSLSRNTIEWIPAGETLVEIRAKKRAQERIRELSNSPKNKKDYQDHYRRLYEVLDREGVVTDENELPRDITGLNVKQTHKVVTKIKTTMRGLNITVLPFKELKEEAA